MEDAILEKYESKRILAVYKGNDAWKKLVPIRWSQVSVRAGVRRRFKNVNMSNSLLVIFLTPKKGKPTNIVTHFYPDKNNVVSDIDAMESDDLWVTQAPYFALEADDAPKLLKKLVKHIS